MTEDARLDKYPPESHGSKHTDGTDDIADATAISKGLATPTQITKLDGVEAGATAYTDGDAEVVADAQIVTHASDADAHHAKSHAHDGLDGSGTVAHSATTGRAANDHHEALEAMNAAGTLLSGRKIVKETFAYTNGGNTYNFIGLTDPAVTPDFAFGYVLNTLTYDNRRQFTALVTSLTYNGTHWVAVIRVNKTYYAGSPSPGIRFEECATNDIYVHMIVGGK